MPRIESDLKLDFKDVLVRPKRSTLKSRADVRRAMLFLAVYFKDTSLPPGGLVPRVRLSEFQVGLQGYTHYSSEHGHSRYIRDGRDFVQGF